MEKEECEMANTQLANAKEVKNDEFYTQYSDIEKEINAYVEFNPDVFSGKTILLPCDDPEWSNFTRYFALNFKRFGLRKLISTSYANGLANKQPTVFELKSPLYDETKHDTHGKLFTLTHDSDDVQFAGYLEGNGDFRSEEVRILRDESDFIITNPPFSLFREFLAWIVEADKKFIIMGNKNAITYKEVFPLLKSNAIWTGYTSLNGGRWMILPKGIDITSDKAKDDGHGNRILNVAGVCWFANVDHGRRHEPLVLDTLEHNVLNNPRLTNGYQRYDNYDAIEVPMVDAIPRDYEGVMGVPITFFNKFNPDQFEIIGATESEGKGFSNGLWHESSGVAQPLINGQRRYKRVFIRKRHS